MKLKNGLNGGLAENIYKHRKQDNMKKMKMRILKIDLTTWVYTHWKYVCVFELMIIGALICFVRGSETVLLYPWRISSIGSLIFLAGFLAFWLLEY